MKNPLLLAAAILVFAPLASAAPLDTKGIPADAQGIIHIDFGQCAKSALAAALWQQADQKKYEAFKTQYGFDPAKDLSGVTMGLIKPADASDAPVFFGVARGKFSPEKITAAARQANARITTEGNRTIIEGLNLDTESAGVSLKKTALCVIDSSTVLFAQTKPDLAKTIAAYTGQTQSYAAPAALAKLGAQTATPLVVGYLGSDITPDAQEGGGMMPISVPKADSVSFLIAENNANLLFRSRSAFANADDAQQLQGTLQMLMGFAQMGIAKAGSGSGPQADQARMLQKLLSTLQVNLNDSTLDISFAYPVDDLVKALQTYAK